jgi:putative dimethyl sulfoxide reductase chaperone
MITVSPDGYEQATAEAGIPLTDVADLRQAAYRLFATSLLYPEAERLTSLAEAAAEFGSDTRFALILPFYPDWQRMLDRLAHLGDREMDSLTAAYRRLFYSHTSDPLCPPYESFYQARSGEDVGWLPAQLLRRYGQAGLAMPPDIEQSPDHVVVELEFMAFLCGHEAQAWDGAVSDSGIRALKREAVFLRRYLGWWFPIFAKKVRRVDLAGFYAQLASAAEAFVHHDQDLIALLLAHAGDQTTAGGVRPHAS